MDGTEGRCQREYDRVPTKEDKGPSRARSCLGRGDCTISLMSESGRAKPIPKGCVDTVEPVFEELARRENVLGFMPRLGCLVMSQVEGDVLTESILRYNCKRCIDWHGLSARHKRGKRTPSCLGTPINPLTRFS